MPQSAVASPRIRKLLKKGIAHHQAGRLEEAEEFYRRSLRLDPRCPQAVHLLGLLARQAGQYHEAVRLITEALVLDPNDATTLDSMANCHLDEGRVEHALPHLARVAELRPNSVEALHRLGKAREKLGDFTEARDVYTHALALDPRAADLLVSLARVFCKLGQAGDAALTCKRALGWHPDNVDVLIQLGQALTDTAEYDGARAAYQRVLALQPTCAPAADGLGYVFERTHDLEHAAQACREAIKLDPKLALARIHLGTIRQLQGDLASAVECFQQALKLDPNCAEARAFLGVVHLLQGDFAAGWPKYEDRWNTLYGLGCRRKFSQPRWRGEPLNGARILLYAEQGLGDTLQFARYIPLVAARGGKVILEIPPRLYRLLASFPGAEKVISWGQPLPEFEWQCPLLSLPLAFQTDLTTIPGGVPYLQPDTALAEHWKRQLPGGTLRVGLAWGGNPEHPYDYWRSVPLAKLAPLTQIEGATFFSLQMGPPSTQVQELGAALRLTDLRNEQQDFADTAAIVANLDLVISVDSAMAHLAGALGKPVWILLHKSADWRWLLDREDSQWYPTARLFRQTELGNWDDVVERVGEELRTRLEGGAPAAVSLPAPPSQEKKPRPPAFRPVVDTIRWLQTKTGTVCRPPRPGDRVGFAFSSKDRPEFTRQTLTSMDQDGGYDFIWNDGSDAPEARDLPGEFPLRNARLVEVNREVRGGPDRSICFGLERLLKLGYDYVGLIENDIVMQPGWFGRLMELFELTAADGLVCGAATIRSYEGRVLEHRAGYSINWGTGAGMILFSRPAAEVILRQYPKLLMSTDFITRLYARLFALDLGLRTQDANGKWTQNSAWLTLDWGYTPTLYLHGYTSVGSIPSLARDLEFAPGHYLLEDYVRPERFNAGLVPRPLPLRP